MPPVRLKKQQHKHEHETHSIFSRLRYQISNDNVPEYDTIANMLCEALFQCLDEANSPELTNRVLDAINEHI
jgi:hypothetical protein